MEEVFGNNELEDVSWLCSLSETELDLLVHLKELVMQRAHIIGNNDLADSFDLKLLRTLAFAVMDFLKGRVNDLSCAPPCLAEALNRSNLLKPDDVKDSIENIGIEELKKCVGVKQGPEPAERSQIKVVFCNKKRKMKPEKLRKPNKFDDL